MRQWKVFIIRSGEVGRPGISCFYRGEISAGRLHTCFRRLLWSVSKSVKVRSRASARIGARSRRVDIDGATSGRCLWFGGGGEASNHPPWEIDDE